MVIAEVIDDAYDKPLYFLVVITTFSCQITGAMERVMEVLKVKQTYFPISRRYMIIY